MKRIGAAAITIQIRLLGRFVLQSQSGKKLTVPSRKGQALIAILAMSGGQPVSRERITGLLWSDRGEQQARSSLRQALTELRRLLPDLDPPLLRTDRDTVYMELDAIEVDTLTFDRLVEEGAPGALAAAIDLYRGDFLENIGVQDPAFDDWLRYERQRLREHAAQTLSQLLDHQAAHDTERAIATARRLVRFDPVREDAHRALMRLLADKGDRTLALKQYHTCREVLAAELGVSPDSETERLAEEIRTGVQGRGAAKASEPGHPAPTSEPLPVPDRPSIAVLPFTNMSGDPEQEYFSDGITEDIITSLSRISWLFVIARHSSFAFKERAVDVRQVSEELGARYVLEGSVQKAAKKVRVTAQLIDAQSSAHLWVGRYDRDLDDIFAVQDEIVGSIVHALGAADGVLEKSERQRSLETQVKNLTAYDCYLQGRDQFERKYDKNFEAAEALFREAIALDTGFARAYSALAWLHFLQFKLLRIESFEDIRQKALDLALHSLRLDRNDYRAHWVLGYLYTCEGKHAQGLAQFDRALTINPNDANVLVWSAEGLIYSGRMEDALERCQRAIRLNPICPDFYHWLLGFSYFHLGRYEDALTALERMTEPQFARRLLAATYAHLDRLEEARSEADEYMRVDPDFSITAWAKTEYYADPQELQRYTDGLRKAGLPE